MSTNFKGCSHVIAGMQSSAGASAQAGGEADPFAMGAAPSPAKKSAQQQQQQKPQMVLDDPFAAPSSSSPAPKSAPGGRVMMANVATPPKKSAADILKMFDSPHGQVWHLTIQLVGP